MSLVNSTLTVGRGTLAFSNAGRLNLIDAIINGDIANTAGGMMDSAGSVTFNGAISGDGWLGVSNLTTLAAHPMANDPAGVCRVGTLSLDVGALFNLSNNALIVDYSAATPFPTLRSLLMSGHNSLVGISSSMTGMSFGLGYAEASSLSLATFAGQSVDSTSVVVKFTRLGDANLDGRVNAWTSTRSPATSAPRATGYGHKGISITTAW